MMQLHKAQLQQFVRDLPDTVEADEVMYRIYLMQKIEEGEEDIRQGHIISHDELRRAYCRCNFGWFQRYPDRVDYLGIDFKGNVEF